jgi:undecaprenyl-diphosphatase
MDVVQVVQSVMLGMIQGTTEWLPISSKAMVSLAMIKFFNSDVELSEAVYYAIWLHFGTLFAVALFYKNDLIALIKNLPHYLKDVNNPRGYNRLTTFLIVSTFFTALIGAPLAVFGLSHVRFSGTIAIVFIGVLLIVTGILQSFARRSMSLNKSLSIKDAVLVGIMQGFATLPGLSRSGLTVSTLLLRRYAAKDALNLSFMMYIPAVLGAEIGLGILKGGLYFNVYSVLAIVVAFVFGIFTIRILLTVAERINFSYFCILLGSLCVLAIFV